VIQKPHLSNVIQAHLWWAMMNFLSKFVAAIFSLLEDSKELVILTAQSYWVAELELLEVEFTL
jgi:hypothetical protein